jgi:hypothetical protein
MNLNDDFTGTPGARMRHADPVPPPPVEEMWSSIEFARRYAPRAVTRRRWPVGAIGIGLAASLALGITIGRMTGAPSAPLTQPGPDTTPAVQTASPAADLPALDRFIAEQHMAEAEVLLADFDRTPPDDGTADMTAWARSLLTDTRLLLESPVANDPDRARLLLDLELVLAQIASLPPANRGAELDIIRDGIRQTNVLARLRTASTQLAAAGM